MGQAKRRGTFEQRLAIARSRVVEYQTVMETKPPTAMPICEPKVGIVGHKPRGSMLLLAALAAALHPPK